MPIQSSYATVAEQIISFNKNVLEILSKINSLSTTNETSVSVQILNEEGVINTYNLPSFTYLKSQIDRLDKNINSLYSIDSTGSIIQTSNQNKFKKIITVDLNREPNSINGLSNISSFKSSKNWIFDGLLNPMLSVELDLSNKIENNVRKCLSRRYIIDFEKDNLGQFTSLGQSALNSFNQLYRGKNDIKINELENWIQTTPGILNSTDFQYDEQVFDIEPNTLLYDGLFNVLKVEEDILNKKLWYHLNTLDYIVISTNEIKQLSINDELIINTEISNTKYKVIEVSTTESNPRVRLEKLEGIQPIPNGIGVLKIYSPVIFNKSLKISIGYNERNVIFLKPINTDNNIVSKNWSTGVGFWTNDLRLSSSDSSNGISMEQYYIDKVYDYGQVLEDLVSKKKPVKWAGTPNKAILTSDNFKVVQINKHLTDSVDSDLLKDKNNYQKSLQSEISQLTDAIEDRNKKLKITRFTSDSSKKQYELEINDLVEKKNSKSKLLATTIQEILDLSKQPISNIEPKFKIRGFWKMPDPVIKRGTDPQEVVQFRIEYKYLSKDGKENQIDTIKIKEDGQNAAYSNWIPVTSALRKRTFNAITGKYTWDKEDVENVDSININQIEIPINVNEKVEIRVKSISEIGWPDSIVESDWSDSLIVEFPDSLNNVLNNNDNIIQDANKEDFKIKMNNELSARGYDEHLSGTTNLNNKVIHHSSDKILSGFKDANGVSLDLFEYLKALEDRVRSLEEKIKKAKGELQITILRNNQEFVIENGSETTFNVECEDYLDKFQGTGIPVGRVYANNMYVIKDFVIKIKNISVDSPLGLLSNRFYSQSPDVYNSSAPQTFWVNNQDELIKSNVTGQTKTQIDNQFIWMVNYDKINQTTISKLSDNIQNNFLNIGNNSLTDILSTSEYNIGYAENSILNFVGNNNSLLDPSKWVDKSISVGTTTKLLTSIHPVISDLEKIVENNSDKIKSIKGKEEIIIPINIYFKMNGLDNTKTGLNYEYINLNRVRHTVKHIKKLRFLLDNESENRPFLFTIKFNINRSKAIIKKNMTFNSIVK